MKAKITLEIEIPKKVPLGKVDEWAKFEVGFSGALGRDNPLYKERLRDKVYSISVMADEGPERKNCLAEDSIASMLRRRSNKPKEHPYEKRIFENPDFHVKVWQDSGKIGIETVWIREELK